MNAEDLRKQLDEIIKLCETKTKWNNADRRQLYKVRRSLGTPSEIAAFLGVSSATLHWWERQVSAGKEEGQPPPPIDHLKRLYELLAGGELATAAGNKRLAATERRASGGVLLARKTYEVLGRVKYGKKSWIMRSGTAFVILTDKKILDDAIEHLRKGGIKTCFVFRAPPKGGSLDSPIFHAKVTFDEFQRKMREASAPRSVLEQIHGVPVSDENDANKLGLVDAWTSFFMIEYNEEGRALFGRMVDVWQEFIINESQDPENQSTRLVWLELPPAQAMEWRASRINLLDRLEKEAQRKR